MRLFLAPLGFHEDFALRSLNKLRATREDAVYAVTCSPVVGGVKRAFEGLSGILARQGLSQPVLVDIDCNDFYGSLKRIRDLVSSLNPDHVYLCAGGGLRGLTIIVLLALVSMKKPFTLHYEPESGVEGFTVEPEFFLNVFEELGEAELKTLKTVISRPGISIRELATSMGVKEKTARNIVTRLKNKGLVVKKGKKEGVEPTRLAVALYSQL